MKEQIKEAIDRIEERINSDGGYSSYFIPKGSAIKIIKEELEQPKTL